MEARRTKRIRLDQTIHNQLNYYVFEALCKQLPLSNIIQLRTICTTWRDHANGYLSQQRSLTLKTISGPVAKPLQQIQSRANWVDLHYSDDIQNYAKAKRELTSSTLVVPIGCLSKITKLFPQINHLTIKWYGYWLIGDIPRLVKFIDKINQNDTIQHFTFWNPIQVDMHSSKFVPQLCDQLIRCSLYRSLTKFDLLAGNVSANNRQYPISINQLLPYLIYFILNKFLSK